MCAGVKELCIPQSFATDNFCSDFCLYECSWPNLMLGGEIMLSEVVAADLSSRDSKHFLGEKPWPLTLNVTDTLGLWVV